MHRVLALIAAAVLGFAVAPPARAAGPPRALEPAAACRFITQERTPDDAAFAIAGTYRADGEHGAIVEIAGCDNAFIAGTDGDAAARIAAYHQAFRDKCGGVLIGDYIPGVFTGRFVGRDGKPDRAPHEPMIDIFIITSIATTKLDAAAIVCPK